MSFQEKYNESKNLLVHMRRRLKVTRDLDLQNEILHVISVLESPLFSRLVTLEEALNRLELISKSKELNTDHFDFNKDTGELEFFTRNTSYRRPLSSSQAESFGKSSKVQKGRGKWPLAAKEETKHKKQTPGKGRKNIKRVDFRQDGAQSEPSAISASDSKPYDDSTLLDPGRKKLSNQETNPEGTKKLTNLDKNLDQIIKHDEEGNQPRKHSQGDFVVGQIEIVVLKRSYPREDLGFGIVEVRNEVGESLGYFVEGILSDGLAARQGGLQEVDRIISINDILLDSRTTQQRILEILTNPNNNSIEICVVRHKSPSLHQVYSFSSIPKTSPHLGNSGIKEIQGVSNDPSIKNTKINNRGTASWLDHPSTGGTKISDFRDSSIPDPKYPTNLDSTVNRDSQSEATGSSLTSPISSNEGGPEVGRRSNYPHRRLPTPVRVENLAKFLPQVPQILPSLPHDKPKSILKESSTESHDMVLNTEWTQLEVISLVNDGAGLGFGIIGGKSTGVVVKTIVSGGVADRDGRLRSGDHILQICDVNVRGLGSEQVAAVLRQSGIQVRLLVARPVVDPSFSLKEGCEGGGFGTPVSLLAPIVPTQQLNQHIQQLNSLLSAYPEIIEFGAEGLLVDIDGQPKIVIANHVTEDNLGYQVDRINNEIEPMIDNQVKVNRIDEQSSIHPNENFAHVEGSIVLRALDATKTDEVVRTVGAVSSVDDDVCNNDNNIESNDLMSPRNQDKMNKADTQNQNIKIDESSKSTHLIVTQKRLSLVTETCSMESMTSPVDVSSNLSTSTNVVPINTGSMSTIRDDSSVDVTPISPSTSKTDTILRVPSKNLVVGDSVEEKKTEHIEVELSKSEGSSGLGITVVGYSSENPEEDISGIFVNNIAENSVAHLDQRLLPNDQIIEVNGRSLIGLSNQQSVGILRCAGNKVRLKVIRYLKGKKFDQLQKCFKSIDLVTHPGDDVIINKWKKILGDGFNIIVATLMKLKEGGGLGLSLEGTVDVEDGLELHPHHYIRSIYPRGPIAVNGRLKAGDELLEVNGIEFYGMDRMHVISTLKDLPQNVCLVAARRSSPVKSTTPTKSPSPVYLPDTSVYKLKAKSDTLLIDLTSAEDVRRHQGINNLYSKINGLESFDNDHVTEKTRSKSLEPISKFGVWSDQVEIVELNKSDKGLGFSILDYQDPLNPDETIIVVGSLVPGGVAHTSSKIFPGDRLVFVNDASVYHATLEEAVSVLKGTSRGKVLLGILKALPVCSGVVGDEKHNSGINSFLEKRVHKSSSSILNSVCYANQSASPVGFHLTPPGGSAHLSLDSNPTHSVPSLATQTECPDNLTSSHDSSIGPPIATGTLSSSSSSASENEYMIADITRNVDGNVKKGTKPSLLPKPKIHVKRINTNGQSTEPRPNSQPVHHKTATHHPSSPSSSSSSSIPHSLIAQRVQHPVERHIVVNKGNTPLGLTLEIAPLLIKYGCVVKGTSGAVERDGRMKVGDLVLSINCENMKDVTNYQAKSILRRVALTGNEMSVVYVQLKDIPSLISPSKEELLPTLRLRIKSLGGDNLEGDLTAEDRRKIFETTSESNDDYAIVKVQLCPTETTLLPPRRMSLVPEVLQGQLGLKLCGQQSGIGAFVSEVMEDGMAAVYGDFLPGDQIISVNGQSLMNKNHLNSSIIIKNFIKSCKILTFYLFRKFDHERKRMPDIVSSRNIQPVHSEDESDVMNSSKPPSECLTKSFPSSISPPAPPLAVTSILTSLMRSSLIPSLFMSEDICQRALTTFPLQDLNVHSKRKSFDPHSTTSMVIDKNKSINHSKSFSDNMDRTEYRSMEDRESVESPIIVEPHMKEVSKFESNEDENKIVLEIEHLIQKASIDDSNSSNIILISKNIHEYSNPISPAEEGNRNYQPDISNHIPSALPSTTTPTFEPIISPVSMASAVSQPPEISNTSTPTSDIPSHQRHQNNKGDLNLMTSSSKRSQTVCPIAVSKYTMITISKKGRPLGLDVIGGINTNLGSLFVHDIFENGAARIDGRLTIGDQILQVNDECLKEISDDLANEILRRTPESVNMLVYRCLVPPGEDDLYELIQVTLLRKPGRGFGFTIVCREPNNGIFVSDLIKGGISELDGQLLPGDHILVANDIDLRRYSLIDAALLLKTVQSRLTLTLGRVKCLSRSTSPSEEDQGNDTV